MALRDQPYIPLYVQDYLTDEKLNMCSLESQGVYIKIMCIMHKSKKYGIILLKQKEKQNSSRCFCFASKLARLLPFTTDDLENAITELVDEGVLQIIGDDKLVQKRMVRDNALSLKRAEAGKKGGDTTQFAKANDKANAKAKIEANSEYEYESENENEKEDKKEKIKRKIIPPKVEWIAEYCKERNNRIDPDGWFDFYQAKNWMIGRNKMVDWQSSVRTWEKRNNESVEGYGSHKINNGKRRNFKDKDNEE